MTPLPGVHIETIHAPAIYTQRQLEQACAVVANLERGPFVLTVLPLYDCDTLLGEGVCELCTWRRENETA